MTWSVLPSSLTTVPARENPEKVAAPVSAALSTLPEDLPVHVFDIDPDLADTAALTEAFGLELQHSANCVLVAGSRAGEERLAACLVLAHTKADVNKRVKKLLDVRKCSFMPMDRAVSDSGMEYGGIGPIGLPADWRLLVDARVLEQPAVVIGSGVRSSKIVLPGADVARLPQVEVHEDLAIEIG
ncbi:YbaK/EbsC family protein [Brevibacterium litoralis]|uniref:YbaK/EbsC family protein n=1 Tax=Brevibacterium litoralis TaxID=3138935 RepID=UPI0032EF5370